MFSNFKLPHGVMVALSGLSVLLTWIVSEQSKGAISLPAAVVGLIPIVQMVLGMFSPSISGGSSGGGSAGGGKSDSVPTVPPPPRMPTTMRRMLSVSGLAVFALAAIAASGDVACTKAQGTQIATVGVDTLVCVLNHSTEPPAQIALTCGVADLEQIATILNAHKAAEIREHAAVVDAGSDQ